MARLGGILPPFLRSPLTGGIDVVESIDVTIEDDMPNITVAEDSVNITLAGTISQASLTAVIDFIGDVIDDFLLDEAAAPVVSRIDPLHSMAVDFGAEGNTFVFSEAAVAPDSGTSIRNPATAGAGSFGAVLQDTDSLDVAGLTEFTIVFWYKAMSGGLNKLRTIAGKPQVWAIGSDNTNKLSWGLETTGTPYSQAYSAGTWFDDSHIGEVQMFAGVYDGTEQRVYRNAVLDGTLAKTGAVIAGTPGTLSVLGNNLVGFGAQAYMYGNLDRVVMFSKALSEEEIQALFVGQRTVNIGTINVTVGE